MIVGFSMDQLQSFLQVFIPEHVSFEIGVLEQVLSLEPVWATMQREKQIIKYLILMGQFMSSSIAIHFKVDHIVFLSLSFAENLIQNIKRKKGENLLEKSETRIPGNNSTD